MVPQQWITIGTDVLTVGLAALGAFWPAGLTNPYVLAVLALLGALGIHQTVTTPTTPTPPKA